MANAAKSRRTKGTGYIRKEGKSGTYYGYIRKGRKVERVKLTRNQRESESMWTKYLTNAGHIRPSAVYGDKTPLSVAIEVAAHKMALAGDGERKIYYYRMMWRWLTDTTSKQYLQDLGFEDVAGVFGKRGASLRNRIVATYKAIFRHNGVDAPFLAEFRRFRDKVRHHVAFTEEETARLLAVEGDDEIRDLVIVGLNTGLRLKDAVNLHREQVVGDCIVATPYKTRTTAGTECVVPLNDALRDLLARRRAFLDSGAGLCFPGLAKDHRERPTALTTRIRRYFAKAGIAGRDRMFHALRTTYITKLVGRGVPLGIIQTVVGHLDPATTMVYVQPHEDMMRRWFS